MLGLVNAALGNKEEAMRDRVAVDLLPISKDAYDGPILETNLAVIYAQVEGKSDRAPRHRLVPLPNGPTPGTLRIEPEWDSLRGDPGFEKLLQAYDLIDLRNTDTGGEMIFAPIDQRRNLFLARFDHVGTARMKRTTAGGFIGEGGSPGKTNSLTQRFPVSDRESARR